MAANGIPIIFGGGTFWTSTVDETAAWLKALERHSISAIDTAESYGGSEAALGETNAASEFTIDTKFSGGLGPTPATAEAVVAAGKESLEKLKTEQVCDDTASTRIIIA